MHISVQSRFLVVAFLSYLTCTVVIYMPDLFRVSLKTTGNVVYISRCLYKPFWSRQYTTLIDICLKSAWYYFIYIALYRLSTSNRLWFQFISFWRYLLIQCTQEKDLKIKWPDWWSDGLDLALNSEFISGVTGTILLILIWLRLTKEQYT